MIDVQQSRSCVHDDLIFNESKELGFGKQRRLWAADPLQAFV